MVLVGDADQLAAGRRRARARDLIESGAVPTVRLTEIFRQAARSLIVRAAHAINAGEPPPTERRPRRRARLLPRHARRRRRDPRGGRRAGQRAGCPATSAFDPRRRGARCSRRCTAARSGIDALNDRLRALLNPDGAADRAAPALRVGDRVIQTVNDHERELMNGELGVLEHHDRERERVAAGHATTGGALTLPADDAGTLRLAYAISVHKAQGSQVPAVVVVLHRGHHVMLTRNLLYTAVTRAERACVLVGEPAALHAALGAPRQPRRHTRLRELVA